MKLTMTGLLLGVLGWNVVPGQSRAADDEDAKLAAFFKDYLEAQFRQRPVLATQLGDHRFDHLLDDVSPKARAAWTEHARKALAELPKRIDYQKLSRPGQIDFEILKHDLTRTLWLAENTNPFETDPTATPQDLYRVIRSEIRAAFLSLAFEACALDGYETDRIDSAALTQITSAAQRAAAVSHHATQCPARINAYGEGCDCEEKPL